MKSSQRHLPVGASATLDDCARLWSTLTTDYIPNLKIEMTVHHRPTGESYVQVELVDYATMGDSGDWHRSVWSIKEFFSPLYLISHTQLFDLLIKGYRVIDEYFTTGKDNRPSPMKG